MRALMPPQPWPKGAAKDVAGQLQVPLNRVSKAVEQLMEQGAFKLQIDGRLYAPEQIDEHPQDKDKITES